MNLKHPLFVLTLLLGQSFCLLAAPATKADLEKNIDIPYTRFVLKNGLTVIVHEDHKAAIIAVNVWYHVGSKNEKLGKTGFAHLFEHLMFNGSEHFNRSEERRVGKECRSRRSSYHEKNRMKSGRRDGWR